MRWPELNPRRVILATVFLFLASYSIYQARAVLVGPRVWITSPRDGESVNTPLITIEGRAKNISWIQLNDRQIYTDEKGNWSEKLIVSPGLSIMSIKARDRFGRETEKRIQIVLNK